MTAEQMAEIIADKERCAVTSFRSHAVTERFKGAVAWEGLVTQFYLKGRRAPSCFAWVDPGSNELVTVLELPPVQSPETAVRAYIVSRGKNES
jgi:hypothetical protein